MQEQSKEITAMIQAIELLDHASEMHYPREMVDKAYNILFNAVYGESDDE